MGSGPIAHEGDTLTPPVKCLGYSMIHSSSAIPLINLGYTQDWYTAIPQSHTP